jgi:Ca2+-binding RTX toxin-like protein
LHSSHQHGETALIKLYNGDDLIHETLINGIGFNTTDKIDGPFQLGDQQQLFNKIVFTVPTNNEYNGDDYLVHKIGFVKETIHSIELQVNPSDNFIADSLVELRISLPEAALLSHGTNNQDGTWTLPVVSQSDGYSVSQDISSGAFTVTGLTVITKGMEEVNNISISAVVADSNGNLLVKAGAENDSLEGGSGNDFIQGGAGNDFLTGGLGDDVFAWSLADVSESQMFTDKVTDFSEGNNVLNFSDLFGTGETLQNLFSEGRINITSDENGDARLELNTDKQVGQVDQVVILEGYANEFEDNQALIDALMTKIILD